MLLTLLKYHLQTDSRESCYPIVTSRSCELEKKKKKKYLPLRRSCLWSVLHSFQTRSSKAKFRLYEQCNVLVGAVTRPKGCRSIRRPRKWWNDNFAIDWNQFKRQRKTNELLAFKKKKNGHEHGQEKMVLVQLRVSSEILFCVEAKSKLRIYRFSQILRYLWLFMRKITVWSIFKVRYRQNSIYSTFSWMILNNNSLKSYSHFRMRRRFDLYIRKLANSGLIW